MAALKLDGTLRGAADLSGVPRTTIWRWSIDPDIAGDSEIQSWMGRKMLRLGIGAAELAEECQRASYRALQEDRASDCKNYTWSAGVYHDKARLAMSSLQQSNTIDHSPGDPHPALDRSNVSHDTSETSADALPSTDAS